MVLSSNINDLEKNKFKELNFDGNTVVKTCPQSLQTNSFQALKTSIGTTPTKIEFPEVGTEFTIYHITAGSLIYVGANNSIAVGDADVAPLPPQFKLNVSVPAGNNNNLYGIVEDSAVDIYVIGMIRDL